MLCWQRNTFYVPNISLVVSVNTFMQILVSIKKMKQNYMKERLVKCCETNVNKAQFFDMHVRHGFDKDSHFHCNIVCSTSFLYLLCDG